MSLRKEVLKMGKHIPAARLHELQLAGNLCQAAYIHPVQVHLQRASLLGSMPMHHCYNAECAAAGKHHTIGVLPMSWVASACIPLEGLEDASAAAGTSRKASTAAAAQRRLLRLLGLSPHAHLCLFELCAGQELCAQRKLLQFMFADLQC